MNRLFAILPFALALPAQAPSPQAPLPPELQQLTEPVFATGTDGSILAAGHDYRLRCNSKGASFEPDLGADQPRAWPITFGLQSATVGGKPLALDPAAPPERARHVVSFPRHAVTEIYELHLRGMEQRFRFDTLPERGELRLAIGVATELIGNTVGDHLEFTGPAGGVHYGAAIAIDANGRRVAMTTRLQQEGIELTVPGWFVAEATLPLVVDPLIATISWIGADTIELRELDIVWNAMRSEYLLVWEKVITQYGSDVYGRRIDANGAPLGPVFGIDLDATAWRRPRVACVPSADRVLVVAEADNVVDDEWIEARVLSFQPGGTPIVGLPIIVAKSGIAGNPFGRYATPDVGGDGAAAGGGNFAIVYAYGNSPDRDIHLRVLDTSGAPVAATSTLIAATAFDERQPRISRGNGTGSPMTQTWAIAYERRISTAGANLAASLWGALIDRTGQRRLLLGAATWQISDSLQSARRGFDISSPTDDVNGSRDFLLVETRPVTNQGTNLFGIRFAHNGIGGNAVDLSQIDQSGPSLLRDQYAPAVDSDGSRFAVVYMHDFSATDPDLRVSTFARQGAGLVAHEAAINVRNTVDREDAPTICARRHGGTQPGRYGIAFRTVSGSTYELDFARYDGLAAGGISWRPTGCGDLQMIAQGEPGLAMVMTLQLQNTSGLGGFLLGLPVPAQVVPGCGNCTLGTSNHGTMFGAQLNLQVPNNPGLVGATVAVQGFDIAAHGACLGQIDGSPTADITVR